jgi:hypothetical protein
MLLKQILRLAPPGTVIPKPDSAGDFKVKGLGERRGEDALIYLIPNHSNPRKPHEKDITASEFEQAYSRLHNARDLTKQWFRNHLPECDAEGSCNFTTVGGIFVLMHEAVYASRGKYRKAS